MRGLSRYLASKIKAHVYVYKDFTRELYSCQTKSESVTYLVPYFYHN